MAQLDNCLLGCFDTQFSLWTLREHLPCRAHSVSSDPSAAAASSVAESVEWIPPTSQLRTRVISQSETFQCRVQGRMSLLVAVASWADTVTTRGDSSSWLLITRRPRTRCGTERISFLTKIHIDGSMSQKFANIFEMYDKL